MAGEPVAVVEHCVAVAINVADDDLDTVDAVAHQLGCKGVAQS